MKVPQKKSPQAADLDGGAALPPAPAVGLLFDLLPDDLLVGEVAAGLAVVLLHASSSKLIYQSIRRSIWRGFLTDLAHFPKQRSRPPAVFRVLQSALMVYRSA